MAVLTLLIACQPNPPIPPPERPGSTAMPVGLSLPVTNYAQEGGLLCWAACGQMVMDFWKVDVSQCAQVQRRYGRTGCCDNQGHSLCNTNGWPQFTEWGFSCRTTTTALAWTALQSQIIQSQPLVFSWMNVGRFGSQIQTGGHMMVAIGFTSEDGEQFVVIHDPARSDLGSITYSEYVAPEGYDHWRDFYDITKR